jgi:regulator of PEP synthase PpsR (kinase-PPPase family)
MKKILNLHLISDGTCQTIKVVANSVLSHFADVELKQYYWPLIKSAQDFEALRQKILDKPGMVIYTLRDENITKMLNDFCLQIGVPCVPAIDHVISEFKNYFEVELSLGKNNRLNERYFDRVDAINFSLNHDDGQSTDTLSQADIILVGASRSSKTPTSVYLAYNGYKTANVPYIIGLPLPSDLFALKNRLIVGLVINPARLAEIRYNRLIEMQSDLSSDYIDIGQVTKECKEARKTFADNNWPVVDVTAKSIEEISAEIIKLYYLFEGGLKREEK